MNASLLLGIRVGDEVEFRFASETGDIGKGNEIIDLLVVVLEMEASVLEGRG